jgi:hypothetical protein
VTENVLPAGAGIVSPPLRRFVPHCSGPGWAIGHPQKLKPLFCKQPHDPALQTTVDLETKARAQTGCRSSRARSKRGPADGSALVQVVITAFRSRVPLSARPRAFETLKVSWSFAQPKSHQDLRKQFI